MSGTSCQIHLKEDARRRAAEALHPTPPAPTPKANTDPVEFLRQWAD